MFYHDSTGIKDNDAGELIPDKTWLPFQIVGVEEKKTKTKGYNMINLKCEVIEDKRWRGKWVWHSVIFIPKGEKGDGISVHFRKCIGEPFGGNDIVDHVRWHGKRFMGKVTIDEYDGKQRNKISAVSQYGEDKRGVQGAARSSGDEVIDKQLTGDDSIPF